MSLYGPQLVDLSGTLFISMINSTEFTDINVFDPAEARNEMNICSTVDASMNTTDHTNGFPRSNHKNVTDYT